VHPPKVPVMRQPCSGHTVVTRQSYGSHKAFIRWSFDGTAQPSVPHALAQPLEGRCASITRVRMHQCCAAGEGSSVCRRGCVQRRARQMATS
jgi:hypothetical protein